MACIAQVAPATAPVRHNAGRSRMLLVHITEVNIGVMPDEMREPASSLGCDPGHGLHQLTHDLRAQHFAQHDQCWRTRLRCRIRQPRQRGV